MEECVGLESLERPARQQQLASRHVALYHRCLGGLHSTQQTDRAQGAWANIVHTVIDEE